MVLRGDMKGPGQVWGITESGTHMETEEQWETAREEGEEGVP